MQINPVGAGQVPAPSAATTGRGKDPAQEADATTSEASHRSARAEAVDRREPGAVAKVAAANVNAAASVAHVRGREATRAAPGSVVDTRA